MKEAFPDSPITNRLLQPQGSDTTIPTGGFYEPRQNEEMSLGLILTSVRKYWYVTILLSALMMAGIIYKTAKEPRIYKSGIQIEIELKSSSTVAEKLVGATGGGNNSSLSDDRTTTIETITQVLKSKTILQKAIETIPDPKLRRPIDQVLGNLKIVPEQNSNILTISYTDTMSARTVAILNALSAAYIEYSVKTKKARTDNSISFIESQLPNSRKRLELSAQELEQFRQKHRFVDPDSSAEGLATYRQELISKLNEIRVASTQTQKQSEELKKQLNTVGLESNNILSTTMLTQDSAYQELFKQLNEIELIYRKEKSRFQDENPLVITAKEKRDVVLLSLKNRAQQVLKREVKDGELTNGAISNFSNTLAQSLASKQTEIQTASASQAAEYRSLYKVYEGVELQIAQLPTLQKKYTELQRQYNLHSQELTAFLQKLQELKIADAEQVIPWKQLDPPEFPRLPISPDVPRQLGLGAIGSLLVGVLAAVGLNKLDNRIDNPDVVKSMTGMPVLTLLPTVNSFEQAEMRGGTFLKPDKNYSYWSFIEAVRTLALGIGLTTERVENQLGRVIALTSSLPKEGKSTITFHTSLALAELGYRVLLVDVDLHKSTVMKLCRKSAMFHSVDCSNSAGLTDILLEGTDWRSLIKISPESKLEVLFSGKKPIHSIALLNSPRFKRLINEWKQEYDYIIFDTPPVVGVSDTRLIGSLADGIIYVVSVNIAQRQTIDRAVDIISSMGTPVLGLAINRVENHYSGYNKYYQYYQTSDNNLPEKSSSLALANRGDREIEL